MPTQLCPTHGLRYDPATASGCIRCRTPTKAPERTTSRRGLLTAAAAGATLATVSLAVRALTSRASPAAPSAPVREFSEIAFGARQGILFEPASIPAGNACPLIVLFDPMGDAGGIVRRYSRAARARGWLAASCADVRNGTSDDADTEVMLDLVAFVSARRRVDPSRVFAAGMSGGACGAYRLAIVRPAVVRGAIVECGHMAPWREVGARATPGLRFYLFTRDDDFNRPATRSLRDAMAAKGCRVTEVEAPGGHAPMGGQELDAAVRWMDSV